MAAVPVIESEADFHVEGAGKPCKTWYTIFGTFPSPTGVRPLICLHGGPGVPHDMLHPIGNLATTRNIPVIMYDQLGCGRSTHLREKMGDESFWTIDLFLSELDNLLAHLKIEEYDLLGQSWGGILANEHAAHQPKGLKKLILANTPASKQLWREAAEVLRAQLPPDVLATLKKHEADGTIASEEYQQAVGFYYGRHMCRVKPPPKEFVESMQAIKEDSTVRFTMNGPEPFRQTGNMRDWALGDKIHKIKFPTLLVNGRYDGAQDSVMEPFFEAFDKVKWVRFAESSHFPQFEEPEEYLKVVGDFLLMK